jgi:hypothetical protein
MKIEKLEDGITLYTNSFVRQHVYFDKIEERDIVFEHWAKAIQELEESKAIYRPVYESQDGETRILKLRYTTPEELISVENRRKKVFGIEIMKLIMIYNEQERSFINVNN